MLTSKTYLKRDTTTENWSQINEDMQFCFSVYGGSHLGRHLENLKTLNNARWASFRFLFYTISPTKISNNLAWGSFARSSRNTLLGNWTRSYLFLHYKNFNEYRKLLYTSDLRSHEHITPCFIQLHWPFYALAGLLQSMLLCT